MDLPVVIPLTLLALGVSALGTLVRPRLDAVVVTVLLAAVWARVNSPVEGAILHTFSADRGFTVADLVSVAGLAVAGLGLLRLLLRWGRASAGPDHHGQGPREQGRHEQGRPVVRAAEPPVRPHQGP
ncbi:hypothetical protein [Kineococcus rubinsiae]|uniref:hypothetical protein n=1 Tax=Kineococcus rubinsiae TaxID=2609562 RepID=UPI0014318D49|nr:hypothetical protein [Kineococcus rubinsiae]NIZ89605.1 hypothetical protein [Kineococcus rubinsiae]